MQIYNVALSVQNQWYSLTVPQGAVAIIIRPRGNNNLEVRRSGGSHFTIPAGDPPLVFDGRLLREPVVLEFRTAVVGGDVAEVAVVY